MCLFLLKTCTHTQKHMHKYTHTQTSTFAHKYTLVHAIPHQTHSKMPLFFPGLFHNCFFYCYLYIYIYLVAFIFVSMNYRMEDNLEVLVLHCVELRHNDNKKCFQGSERFGIVGSSANFFGQLSTMFFT